jgi:hypothetical protein
MSMEDDISCSTASTPEESRAAESSGQGQAPRIAGFKSPAFPGFLGIKTFQVGSPSSGDPL